MPEQNASLEAKNEHFEKVLEKFVDYHVFHLGVTVDDKVQNYGLSLIELFIVLMQLNDTIHEGDGDRNVRRVNPHAKCHCSKYYSLFARL